jgi:hypothetical protein
MLYDDSDLYDALLPASAAQLDYLNLARSCAGAVLALAWGSGQLIVPVAATGVSATGLDQSSKMLLAASRRAAFFSSVRCHLKPDGVLVFDISTPTFGCFPVQAESGST